MTTNGRYKNSGDTKNKNIMKIQMTEKGKIVYCNDDGKPLFLYNVRVRFSLWLNGLIGTGKAKVWWWKGRLKNYAWFQTRAWNALRGKEMIIDSRQVKSNGGFLYHQLEISKCPVSKTECVE